MPPNVSMKKTKANANKPRNIIILLTKIVEQRSFGCRPKQLFTKSSKRTTEVELNPTDRELEQIW